MSGQEQTIGAGAPSSQGQSWFAETHARINAFADEAASAAGSAIPAPAPPASLIDLLAGRPPSVEAVEVLEGPDAIAAYAEARGFQSELAFKAPAALTVADMPALLSMRDGGCRLLVARDGVRFQALSDRGAYALDLADLKREAGGFALLLRPKSTIEPARPDEDPVAEAIRFVREKQGWMLARLMIAAALSNLLLLALPIYSGLVFDRVIPHAALDTLWAISLGVVLALAADLALRWVRLKIQDAISCRASATLQAGVMRRLLHSQLAKAPRVAGAISVRLREIEHLSQIVPQLIVSVAVDVPFLGLVFLLVWLNGGPVVLAPLIGIAVLVALHHLSHWASAGPQVKAARLAQNQANRVIEAVDGLETIKATRQERRILGRFERVYAEHAYASHVGRFWHGFAGYASNVIGQAMIVLVMVFGVYQVTQGTMTIGALTTCTLLVSRIIVPVAQLVTLLHRVRQIRDTLKAVSQSGREALEEQGDTSGARSAPIRGEIRFNAVTFAYPGQAAPQVSGLSFAIRPGEKVAVIGRSGSGKSTLLRLMVRLYEPDGGSVLIDGMEARQYEPQVLRTALGYLGQNPGLMDDSLLANLTLGAADAAPARIDEVAALTGVREIAARHPQGFGLQVGPRGEALSGGERQAVALARTLLCDTKVLILDEPTAAMDTILEARLAKELKQVLAQHTLVLATHRAPLLELVDRLIWLDHGQIVADGPKDEVLRRLRGLHDAPPVDRLPPWPPSNGVEVMSHSSDQSEDYWPGYVDALTSMVQVLAFVMMLLSVAIFVLSKDASKGAVEQIAKAANVSASPNATVKELTDKIMEELAKPRSEAKPEAQAMLVEKPKVEQPIKAEEKAKTEDKTKTEDSAKAEEKASTEEKAKTEEKAPTEARESSQGRGRPENETQKSDTAAATTSSGEVQSEGSRPTAVSTVQRNAASSNVQAGETAEPPPNAKRITLGFADRSYRMEPAAAGAVTGFVAAENLASGKARILVRAYASNATGAVTEGRRMAYYRGMVARQMLMAQKVPAAAIAIRIIDTSDPEQGGKIEIYAVPEGAP